MRRRANVRRSRRRPRYTGMRRGVKRAVKKFKKRVFRKRVQRIIQSSAETKVFSKRSTKYPSTIASGIGNLYDNTYILTPAVTTVGSDGELYDGINMDRGTADGQRVGNKVRVKKAMFNIVCTPMPQDSVQNPSIRPLWCRIFFYRKKVNPGTMPPTVDMTSAGNFFQNGITQVGFNGTVLDYNMMMNTDMYTYLGHKTFKLGFADYNGTGTNTQPTWQYFSNNDYKMTYARRFNITKMLPKQFAWNDNGNVVTPYTLATIQVVDGSGGAAVTNTFPMKIEAEQYYEYTDI